MTIIAINLVSGTWIIVVTTYRNATSLTLHIIVLLLVSTIYEPYIVAATLRNATKNRYMVYISWILRPKSCLRNKM